MTRAFIRSVEKFTGQAKLRKLYEDRLDQSPQPGMFFEDAIRLLELNIDVKGGVLDDIEPPEGPVIFIANHPYGVLDGIIFTWLTQQIRPDTKVMANSVLCRAPEARDHLLPVDFGGTREAMRTNLDTRKAALQLLKDDGALGLFPGGGVAASQKPFSGPAVDPHWSSFLAKLVRKSQATVIPVYFAGQNSRLFQIASHTSYPLRLALYFRETSRLMGKTIQVAVGRPVNGDELCELPDNEAITTKLRQVTFELAQTLNLPRRRVQRADQQFIYPARFGL